MPRFYVRAVDRSGTRVSTVSMAEDASIIRAALAERQWTVLKIHPIYGDRWRIFQLQRVANRGGALLIRQLGELLRVGVSISTALHDVQQLAPRGSLAAAWRQIERSVDRGESLVEAFSACPGLLGERHLSALAIGQSRDELAKALIDISDELKWRSEVLERWQRASSYPLLVGVLLIAVCWFLLTEVVPSLSPMLVPIMSELPQVTQWVMSWSESLTLSSDFVFYGIGYLALVGIIIELLRRGFILPEVVRAGLVTWWLRGSLARTWLWPFSVAAHAQTVRMLLRQNVALSDAVRMAAPAASLLGTHRVWRNVATQVERDGLFADALEQAGVIPGLYGSLVRVGESHGTLLESLTTASAVFHDRAVGRLQRVDQLIGPVLILVVGSLMVAVMVWILMPVYDLISVQGGAV